MIMRKNHWLVRSFLLTLVVMTASLTSRFALAGDGQKKVWNFDGEAVGKIARGFSNEVGRWEVARDEARQVLYQKARNEDATFNVTLVEGTQYKDLDLSVQLRAVAGEVDRGGGVVWRAKDRNNYYVCRYNPLEDNFRVYKVEAGKRTMFKGARTDGDEKWHTLRVTMSGAKITCFFDGRKLLEAEDETFKEAGMIGLWSKADAQTYFDDLTVSD
jgi:3-keto-disaccharide hydrolase